MRNPLGPIAAVCGVFLLAALSVGRSQADTIVLSNLGLLEQLTAGAVDDVLAELELDPAEPIVLVSLSQHEGNVFVKDRLARALSERGFDVVVSRAAIDSSDVVATGVGSAGGAPAAPAANGNEDEESEAKETGGPGAADEGGDEGAETETGADANAEDAGARGDEVAAPDPSGDAPVRVGDPIALAERALSHAVPTTGAQRATVLDVEILEFGIRYSEVSRRLVLGPVQFTRVGGVYLRVTQHDGTTGYVEDMTTAERHHWDRVSGRERLLAEGASYPFAKPELRAPTLSTYLEPALVVAIVGGLVFLFYENQN